MINDNEASKWHSIKVFFYYVYICVFIQPLFAESSHQEQILINKMQMACYATSLCSNVYCSMKYQISHLFLLQYVFSVCAHVSVMFSDTHTQ